MLPSEGQQFGESFRKKEDWKERNIDGGDRELTFLADRMRSGADSLEWMSFFC